MRNQQLLGALAERRAILRHLRNLARSGPAAKIADLITWLKGRAGRYYRAKGGLRPRGAH